MWLRRVFYFLQLPAAFVIPAWIIIAPIISPSALGGIDVLIFFTWPALAVALLLAFGLTRARRSVRVSRLVSREDVAWHGAWYLIALSFGGFVAAASGTALWFTGVALVMVSAGTIVSAARQLVRAAREAMEEALTGFEAAARNASVQATDARPVGNFEATRFDGPGQRVIRIDPPSR